MLAIKTSPATTPVGLLIAIILLDPLSATAFVVALPRCAIWARISPCMAAKARKVRRINLINPEFFVESIEKLNCFALRRIEKSGLIPEIPETKDFMKLRKTKNCPFG
jgi:hypothetical protein